jgi:anion-transporting  ArsA/GET3 family ATPase
LGSRIACVSETLKVALKKARVLVCIGPGGVGKTTVAAALALGNALQRSPSLVCTIDPAKRLANALGVESLGNAETRISPQQLARASLPEDVPLSAMMLDMKQSWDELMRQLLSPAAAEKIFANRFYQSLSTTLAGSQEYIALERVAHFLNQKTYSLVVLDTPPAAHALDFLAAPRKVLDVLGGQSAKWFLTPALTAGKWGLSLFNMGGSYAAKALAKLTGAETLSQLADFLLSLRGANEGLQDRARRVETLLGEPTTQFVLVTAPTTERLDELAKLRGQLRERGLSVAAVVVNRVHFPPTRAQREAAEALPSPLREKVKLTLEEASQMAERDGRGIAEIERLYDSEQRVLLPRLDKDVHDLSGLHLVSRYLLGEETLTR